MNYCQPYLLVIFLILALTRSGRVNADVSYCNCDGTFDEVSSLDFIPVKDLVINNGLNNGPYWLRIIQQGDQVSRIVRLPFPRLRNPSIHSSGEPADIYTDRAFYEFQLPPLDKDTPYYIYVEAYRSAYIPIQIVAEDAFERYRVRFTLNIGMYYGFSVAIFLSSLFLYLFFRENTYFYYSGLLFVVGFTFAFEDGAFLFWGFPWEVFDVLDSILHWSTGLFCTLLAWHYVQFEDHIPSIKWPLIVATLLSGLSFVIYHITGSVFSSSMGDVFTMLSLFIIGVGSLMLYRKSKFAKLFSLAYTLILICAIDVYIPKHFGWEFIGLSLHALKIGNIVGMIMFGVVIALRINHMFHENLKHKAEIRRMLAEISLEEEKRQAQIQTNGPLEEEKKTLQEEQLNALQNQDVRSKYAMLEAYELTDRQLDILDGIKQGFTNQEIADELNISLNTVKYHTKNIYEKMGVKRRAQILVLNS